MRRLCVFCGSKHGTRNAYADAARALGLRLADGVANASEPSVVESAAHRCTAQGGCFAA
jgi:predicted Rossmann-fold nucleotide-binding protein